MKTTLIIDDDVFKEAQRQALEFGLTLSELTTLALREALRRREAAVARAATSIPTYGVPTGSDSTPAEFAEFRDDGR